LQYINEEVKTMIYEEKEIDEYNEEELKAIFG